MSDKDRLRIKRKSEMRTKEISRMIDEGGLGADKYYDIFKSKPANNDTASRSKSEPPHNDKQN